MGRRGIVSVVGGANIDIVAKSQEIYFPGTSNPGTVTKTPGGVGRNLAHILVLLGVEVQLLTVVGDDEAGKVIIRSAKEAGIATEAIILSKEKKTGEYIAVQDADGTLAAAVSDMEAMELLSPEALEERRENLSVSEMIVADTNLSEASLTWLSEFCYTERIPLYLEPVSKEKAGRLAFLPYPAESISPSETEFLQIFNLSKRGFDSLVYSVDESPGSPIRLTSTKNRYGRPSQNILLTLGSRGALHLKLESDGEQPETAGLWCGRLFRPYPVEVINDNGAGDAFFAGFIAALWHEKSEEEAVLYGLATAARVLRCPDAVDVDLNFEAVTNYISTHETRD